MKLNSAQLEAFTAVARLLNFTKAADTLHVTQSALSQRIAKLEEELETTLFIRDRASLRLTEAGEHVLRFCQLNEHAESDLIAKLKYSSDDLAGTLRIGGFSSVNRSIVIPAIKKLMQDHSRLSVQLLTRELRELEALLKSAEVDYIITNQKSDFSNVKCILLGFEHNVLVQAKKFSGENIFLDHDETDPTTRSYFAQHKQVFQPSTMRYLDDVYGLLDGVKNGFGRAVLPVHLIEGEKDLEILDPKRRLIVPVYLSFYAQPYYKRGHDEVVGALTDAFGKKLPQEK